jgi:hypothetical protein
MNNFRIGSWSYDWDTTQGPNGVFALIARATDEAGNVTTDQVNVIVDNAPPTVTLTDSWEIWDTARASVFKNVIPLGSIQLTVECGDQPDRVYNYNANNGAFDFKWDRRCGDGNLAPSGAYTVVLEACDIYHNCDEARGKVDIPFVAAIIAPPTSTPMPTLEEVETEQVWYNTPTPVPSFTPTPQELVLPILPATGGDDSGDGNIPTGSDQPLLPLAAAALGTSVLLAASSKREEREAQAAARLEEMQKSSEEDQVANQAAREASVAAQTVATVNEETPYVEVSTLAALAGVVKETFEGVWEDAIRISAADAPITIVTHNWVNGVDPQKRLQEIAENDAFIAWFYQNVYLPNKEKEEEEERQAAIQWLADNKARTDEAARVAKEQEIAKTIAAQRAAAAAATLNKKMTRDEEYTEDKNVIQMDYSEMMQKFHEKETQDIETYKEQQWNEKFNSFTVPDYMKTSYLGTGPSAESVFTSDEALQEVFDANIAKLVEEGKANSWVANFLNSASAGLGILHNFYLDLKEWNDNKPIQRMVTAFAWSIIPVVGDGTDLLKEWINKRNNQPVDGLNVSLSIAGLVFDVIPFDGLIGDSAVAALKALAKMIPPGPARDILAKVVKKSDPGDLIKLGDVAKGLIKHPELIDPFIKNPKAFEAILNSSTEAIEKVAKEGPEVIPLIDKFGDNGLKYFLEGGAESIENMTLLAKLDGNPGRIVTDLVSGSKTSGKGAVFQLEQIKSLDIEKISGVEVEIPNGRIDLLLKDNTIIDYKSLEFSNYNDFVQEMEINKIIQQIENYKKYQVANDKIGPIKIIFDEQLPKWAIEDLKEAGAIVEIIK